MLKPHLNGKMPIQIFKGHFFRVFVTIKPVYLVRNKFLVEIWEQHRFAKQINWHKLHYIMSQHKYIKI